MSSLTKQFVLRRVPVRRGSTFDLKGYVTHTLGSVPGLSAHLHSIVKVQRLGATRFTSTGKYHQPSQVVLVECSSPEARNHFLAQKAAITRSTNLITDAALTKEQLKHRESLAIYFALLEQHGYKPHWKLDRLFYLNSRKESVPFQPFSAAARALFKTSIPSTHYTVNSQPTKASVPPCNTTHSAHTTSACANASTDSHSQHIPTPDISAEPAAPAHTDEDTTSFSFQPTQPHSTTSPSLMDSQDSQQFEDISDQPEDYEDISDTLPDFSDQSPIPPAHALPCSSTPAHNCTIALDMLTSEDSEIVSQVWDNDQQVTTFADQVRESISAYASRALPSLKQQATADYNMDTYDRFDNMLHQVLPLTITALSQLKTSWMPPFHDNEQPLPEYCEDIAATLDHWIPHLGTDYLDAVVKPMVELMLSVEFYVYEKGLLPRDS